MYKVVNVKRTAKVDAPSMEAAAAQFLRLGGCDLSTRRLFCCAQTPHSMMLGIRTIDLYETDERVAVFEIEEDDEEKLLAREAAICAEEME